MSFKVKESGSCFKVLFLMVNIVFSITLVVWELQLLPFKYYSYISSNLSLYASLITSLGK